MYETGWRALSGRGDRTGNRADRVPRLDCGNQERHGGLALALEHAIDGARPVRDDRARGRVGAVAADANEDSRVTGLCRLGDIDDLGHVSQIIERDLGGMELTVITTLYKCTL